MVNSRCRELVLISLVTAGGNLVVAANTRRICEARERCKQEYQILEGHVAGKDMALQGKSL